LPPVASMVIVSINDNHKIVISISIIVVNIRDVCNNFQSVWIITIHLERIGYSDYK
jgi:hypothetical protein